MNAELTSINRLFEAADLADGPRQTVASCLKKLPELYEKLASTYENRYADEILRLLRAMLAFAPGLAEELISLSRSMHERLGLPGLDLRALAPAKQPKRRVS